MTPSDAPAPRAATLRRILATFRDAWLILGVALVMLVALEGGYRLQAAVKHLRKPGAELVDSSGYPYRDAAWFADFHAATKRVRFDLDPYRGFWAQALTSRFLNIDAKGHRVTVQPSRLPQARRVLVFGGSAMWGLTERDSATIPSLLAAALIRAGVNDVEVVNMAQIGFNATQESAALQLELARGARPAAAVFLNGYNDIASALISGGRIGNTYTQGQAQTQRDIGSAGFWATLAGLGRFSALIQRLRGQANPPPIPSVPAATLCPRVAAYYAGIERNVLAIARDRGFPALIFLQPHNTTTGKRLTPWEAALPRDLRIRACANAIDSAMAPLAAGTFFDLRSVFDHDTEAVFVDYHSHVTEAASRQIADAIAERLVQLLQQHSGR